MLDRRGARSNFLGYHGFPAVACISPNEVIVHGIPRRRVLEDGDIVSIDCGAIIEGWHADAAITVPVGEVDDESQRLIDVTRASLDAAIDAGRRREPARRHRRRGRGRRRAGRLLGGARVRRPRDRHRDARGPEVPNYGPAGRGLRLQGGHGARDRADGERGHRRDRVLDDGWTVVTADGSRSAHFEHTIAITDHGPEVLTLPCG